MIKHQLSSQNWHLKIRLKPRHSSFFFLLARQDLLVPGLLFCRSTEHFSQRQGSDLVTRKVQKFKLVLMTDVWVWSCCRFDFFFLIICLILIIHELLWSFISETMKVQEPWTSSTGWEEQKFLLKQGVETLHKTRSWSGLNTIKCAAQVMTQERGLCQGDHRERCWSKHSMWKVFFLSLWQFGCDGIVLRSTSW